VLYRPQEEYCEWHVLRNAETNTIRRVTFTSEPPEYWQAFSGVVPGAAEPPIADARFPGDTAVLLKLYRDLVSPDVQLHDLLAEEDIPDGAGGVLVPKGQYNIYNKWNTTHGIAHLNSPPNSLLAEIQLGCDATIRYTNPQGKLLVEPDALIAYAGYGGSNRNSDPTIGGSVNALARLGAYVTLQNPVGLYMDHIDLSGWRAPDNGTVADCVRIARGRPGMIERMVVEIPPDRNFDVGDLTIAGTPIRWGGQIAECITVKLVGVANIVSPPVDRPAVADQWKAFVDPFYARLIDRQGEPVAQGYLEAYRDQGISEAESFAPAALRIPIATPIRTAQRRIGVGKTRS